MATALAACATLGLRSKFAGVIGSDDNGTRVQEALVARGVDVADAVVHHGPNQFAVILVDERTGRAHGALEPRRHDRAARRRAAAGAPALGAGRPRRRCRSAGRDSGGDDGARGGAIVTSDIDRVTDRTEELVAAVSIPILAEHVPAALTGEAEVGRALRILHERHGTMMCVTLGRSGAMIVDGGRVHYAPAFTVDAVDTTGAGDVFRGAFIYGLLRGGRARRRCCDSPTPPPP